MVEELEKTESTWKMHPSAARNKQLLKKWKSQLKVIKNSIILIFPIGFCIPIIFSNFNLNFCMSLYIQWPLRNFYTFHHLVDFYRNTISE